MADLRELARSLRQNLHRYLLPEARPTSRILGTGSYGSVEEVEVNGIVCAGKKIHEALLDGGNFGVHVIARKYAEECQLMTEIRHPNVVQFLGVCFCTGSVLPLLVMERLETSLDDLLETTPDIPLAIRMTALVGTARGLLYLHQRDPPVIHRDLTAKNILLTASFEAKITDFGNSRMVDLQPGRLGTLSRLPGTLVYMPPEAHDAGARYGPSLDVFSFGHCALFASTQNFPGDLKSSTYPDPASPHRILARSEVERREEYMLQLEQQLTGGREHPLAVLIMRCLHNAPDCRPTTEGLVEELRVIKTSIDGPYYSDMVAKLDVARVGMSRAARNRDQQFQQLQQRMTQLEVDKNAAEARVEVQVTELREKNIQVNNLQRQLWQKDEEILLKDNDLDQLRLTTSAEIDRLERSCELLRAELAHREERLRQQGADIAALSSHLEELQHLATVEDKAPLQVPLKLEWKRCCDMPFAMFGNPHSVLLRSKLYVGGGVANKEDKHTAVVYDLSSDKWRKLRDYKFKYFAMTVVNGELIVVAGCDPSSADKVSNELGVWNEHSEEWKHPYPPMKQACHSPAVVVYNHYLIVAGGIGNEGSHLSRVEILDTRSNTWFNAASLPEGCKQMTSAVVDDVWYLMGGFMPSQDQDQAVFTASIPALISEAQSSSATQPVHGSATVWRTLTDAPMRYSHALSLRGSLLALGGRDPNANLERSSAIFHYQVSTRSWVKVGIMPFVRCFVACAVLPGGRFLVAGGGGGSSRLDIATLV